MCISLAFSSYSDSSSSHSLNWCEKQISRLFVLLWLLKGKGGKHTHTRGWDRKTFSNILSLVGCQWVCVFYTWLTQAAIFITLDVLVWKNIVFDCRMPDWRWGGEKLAGFESAALPKDILANALRLCRQCFVVSWYRSLLILSCTLMSQSHCLLTDRKCTKCIHITALFIYIILSLLTYLFLCFIFKSEATKQTAWGAGSILSWLSACKEEYNTGT